MKTKNLIRHTAVVGNVLFILWISFNAIDEGFKGTPTQVVSYIGLSGLLVLNLILISDATKVD